jgi:erythronate-4-phosphate dehydrogenase
MLAAAVRAWAEAEGEAPVAPYVPTAPPPQIVTAPTAGDPGPPGQAATAWLDSLARQACDVRAEDARFRAAMTGASPADRAATFADLRRSYPPRREMASCVVAGDVPDALRDAVTGGLGMRLG